MAMAVDALFGKQVGRIVLTRPAVEAGEKLGFLPGTMREKVDPYFRPLFDALYDMIDGEKLAALMEKGEIEVAPLAFMRGRTLNDSFVILDEAQNTSPEQMKMFLTRLGFGTKMVVTGDVTQIDLPHSRTSGLVTVTEVLDDVDDITFVEFDGHDVVRHKLVQRIVDAYKAHDDQVDAARAQRAALRPAPWQGGSVNLVEVVNTTRTQVDEELVARLVATVLEAEGVLGAEVAVAFVGEARMRALNREHRGKDEVTDVLSFPLEDWDDAAGLRATTSGGSSLPLPPASPRRRRRPPTSVMSRRPSWPARPARR